MTEAIRIAVLNFVHETVTFLPNDTTLDDFVHDGSPARGEALLAWEPQSYMGGFVKVAREHAGVELVGIESPLWPRTGTGSGWITTEAYEHFLGRMLAELEDGGRWDGVYLALHGAMGVRGVARPEADIARRVRELVATWAWRRREALLKTATVHPIPHGVKLAKEAVERGAWPVVLADHSDRSGSATWILQQVIAQDLADVLIATIADRTAVEAVVAKGLKAGDPFDMDVGGLADESAGHPVRIKGTIAGVAHIAGRHWVSVAFGRGNVVLISEYLTQVMDPLDLKGPGFTIDQFKVFAIKSRVHFRRGFDDSGFAKTILLTEPEQPFLGTVRLEALPYKNVDISKFYPYGDVSFPE